MLQDTIKILMIDDNEGDCRLIKEMLKESSNSTVIEFAFTYDSGIEKLSNENFDICLLDYLLNGKNGIDILKNDFDTPIIMLTGVGNTDIDLEVMELGAYDFLDKNKLDTNILERSIRYSIKQHSTVKELLETNKKLTDLLEKQKFLDTVIDNMFSHIRAYNSLKKFYSKNGYKND